MNKIPYNFTSNLGNEVEYIQQSLNSGSTAGDSQFTKKATELLKNATHAKSVLLTPSCTASLEMMALLCNIKDGDEVIMPSYTFVSTANAFALRGAKIVFTEINDILNLDETLLEQHITKKTKVISPVHYAGVSCEMDTILDIGKKNNIFVCEDAAQGVDATYKGKALGTIGQMGAFSFHATKNISAGEGGAILINDESLIERAEVIREKGTNRSKFLKGEVDKYTWVDIGSSYLLADVNAAYLSAQLEKKDLIKQKRLAIAKRYQDNLKPLAEKEKIKIMSVPKNCGYNGHIFYFNVRKPEIRDDLLSYLRNNGVQATSHYVPLHLSPVGKKMGYSEGDFPLTEKLAATIIRLPLFYTLTDKQIDYVSEKVTLYFKNLAKDLT